MCLGGIFWLINSFHNLVGDWGLAIIMVTVLFRIVIYPITRKQFKSTYKMQKLQPLLKEINEKYANDPQRKQQETAKVYKEAKFSPLSGCLPMLLQMPIFVALFQVLSRLYTDFDAGLHAPYTFFHILPDITQSPSAVFNNEGWITAIPYLVVLALFGASILVPTLLAPQQPGQNSNFIMAIAMAAIMLFIGWGSGAGVLLYWATSSYIGVIQQLGSRYLYKRKDAREEAAVIDITPVKVEVDRKERKARPRKKN